MSQLLQDFEAAHPAIAAWWTGSDYPFAVSLRAFAARRGYLTDNQQAAALRCIEKFNASKVSRANAPEIATSKLEEVFHTALGKGLQKPALTVGEFRFTPAPAVGANPGAIYVKQDGAYLGKMAGGKLLARCTQEAMDRILAIANDPLGEAIAHGKLTGRCAICSRKLSDAESVERGIGPICASKFFGV